MKLRLHLFTAFSIFISPTIAKDFSWKEEMPFGSGSITKGKAILSVYRKNIAGKERLIADIKFQNHTEGREFYNPYYSRIVPCPAALVVFDENKKYIKNLFSNRFGSRIAPKAADSFWVHIASSGYVGVEYPLMLSTGKYYLQVVYDKSFVYKNGRGELFRSNVVEVIIPEGFADTDAYSNESRGYTFHFFRGSFLRGID